MGREVEPMADKNSDTVQKFYKGFKSEFKRIIWPNRQTLLKQTTTVIALSVLVGVIISIMDFIVGTGINLIIR